MTDHVPKPDPSVTDAIRRAANGNGRDPRIDKAVSWGLTTLATLALAWVGSEVRSVSSKLDAMNVRLSILESSGLTTKLERLEDRVRTLEIERRKP
jgi:hypothetical protein